MPDMKMNRDFILNTKNGVKVFFTKDEPAWVVPRAVEEARRFGAEFVNEDDKAKIEETENVKKNEVKRAPVGDELDDKLRSVLEEFIMRNSRDDFTASGTPKMDLVKAQLGFDVSKAAVSKVWTAMTNEREGRAIESSSDESV